MSIWARAVADKRRIIVPLVVGIIANVVLYAVVVFPLGRQVLSTEQEERTARDQLVQAREDYNNAKATVSGKQQADLALQSFYKDTLPGDLSTARRLTFTRLADLAKQTNVRLEHGTNENVHEKGSSLWKLTTRYTLEGDYRDVRKFIYALETAPEFIVLENIGLTSAGPDQPQQSNKGVAMSLEISTYYRSGNAAE